MRATPKTPVSRRTPLRIALLICSALVLLLTSLVPAFANHAGDRNLPGSNFEIDENANLIDNPDYTPETADWATVTEVRATDVATGQNDDSYKGGVKEDTECPNETTGSIPNNKSDLLTFHVYEEPGAGNHPGYLNLAWSRVSDPSGTTLMDFEFNQSTTPCPQGPNVVRTGDGDGPLTDDLLIEYAIDQGGARADITGRFWTGSEWGPAIDLDTGTQCGGGPCATGTINQTAIPAAESDGLISTGSKAARTFGEAQIDLRLIFDDQSCASFGSAMLKSRSSDSFTSQLKDFIRPKPIDIQNCAQVVIRKETDPDGATAEFGYTKAFPTDPASENTFTLSDGEAQDYGDTVLFGTGYTVTEDVVPDGWDFVSIDCSASENVTPSVDGTTITFDIDSDEDVLDCTYFNEAKGSITVAKVTDPSPDESGSTFLFDRSWVDNPGGGSSDLELMDGDSETTADLAPGSYSVSELDPSPWTLETVVCENGEGVDQGDGSNLDLAAGEDITCTFTNRVRGEVNILKVDDGDNTLAGVVFDLFEDNDPTGGAPGPEDTDGITPIGSCTTDAQGTCSITDLVPGIYWVIEDTSSLPDGYTPADPQQAVISVDGDLTINLTFVNPRQLGAIKIVKTRKHAADGPGDQPHAGVTFTVEGGTLPAGGTDVVTDANGEACIDGLFVSALEGDYTVTETVPSGYVADGDTTKTVTVTAESTCGDGNEATASFSNTPLTDVTVSVDSIVPGGTASTISCTDSDGNVFNGSTGAGGDGSLTVNDLLPTDPTVTLTCEIVVDP